MKIKDVAKGKETIKYWLKVIEESAIQNIDPEKAMMLDASEILSGQIHDTRILDQLKDGIKKDKKGKLEKEEILVLVSLVTIVINQSHYDESKPNRDPFSVVSLSANLNVLTGELIPIEGVLPKINRNLLSPGNHNDFPCITNLKKAGEYTSTNKLKVLDWKAVVDYSTEMLQSLTGDTNAVKGVWTLPENYLHCNQSYIETVESYSNANLINGYQALHSDKGGEINQVFKNLIEGNDDKTNTVDELTAITSMDHTGSMSNKYPSTTSQRIGIHHAAAADIGEVIAVNGPPGTGKTTLLQSVVASYWVNAAIEKGRPPLIFAAAATNQAVTNIIDSFQNALDDDSVYWRSDNLKSLGLYICAQSNEYKAKAQGYLYARNDFYDTTNPLEHEANLKLHGSFSSHIQLQETLQDEVKAYLKRSETPDLSSAIDKLHKQLLKLHAKQHDFTRLVKEAVSIGIELDHQKADIDQHKEVFEQRKITVSALLESLTKLLDDTKKASLNRAWWEIFLSFIPAVKKYTRTKYRASISISKNISPSQVIEMFGTDFCYLDEPVTVFDRIENEIRSAEALLVDNSQDMGVLLQISDLLAEEGNQSATIRQAVTTKLDCEYRYGMFVTALNYWYGRFLDEAQKLHTDPPKKKQKRREILQRYAMVTPCMVSTMANLPNTIKETSYWHSDQKSREIIDLLIIDEAGQATPEESAYLFSLTKRGLVVGDQSQIEPVFSITKEMDELCLSESGFAVSEQDIEKYKKSKFVSSSGNLMGMALRATPYQMDEETPGLLLREHFRCQKEIIDYCNKLTYDNKLIPMAHEIETEYPKMGFVNVETSSRRINRSRVNDGQIKAVVTWLKQYGQKLANEYGDSANSSIATEIAIITPFKKMSENITAELKKQNLFTDGTNTMTVGTVHSLQGAERNVVLFLSTYGKGDTSQYFIDNKPNLLNVAASRAKKHFVVFGSESALSSNKSNGPVHQLMTLVKPWASVLYKSSGIL